MGDGSGKGRGKLGLGAAVAGWVVAFFPAVVPLALALWCLGLAVSVGRWRRTRSSYGVAGMIAAALGFGWVILGIGLGLAFF